jgi:hypothetical protein
MPSATSPKLRSPWVKFLSEVDRQLPGPVEIHCLGGFVVAMHYGLPRPTADVDYIEIRPPEAMKVLEETAGRGSPLARKHGLCFHHVGIVTPPESYTDRLIELFPRQFQNLRLFALEAHDLALCKLERNLPVDRRDVAYLAKTVPLDPALLRKRYEQELRSIVMGDVKRHDQTLEMWIAAYFPSRT